MSRSRDRADGADLSVYAPLASPTFTGTTDISSGATFPAGHIIQVVNVPFNDQLSVTGGTAGDVKEFDALTITNGSKLLIQLDCSLGGNANTRIQYQVKTASDGSYATLSSASGIGSNTLSAQSGTDSMTADQIILSHNHATSHYGSHSLSSNHLIGPITSTYFRLKLQLLSMYTETGSINRRTNDTTASGRSYITFMEIAQ
tara:strand:- start:327 stop:932 length:606 start_codon:yes stop_codon:yes gene_type:complete